MPSRIRYLCGALVLAVLAVSYWRLIATGMHCNRDEPNWITSGVLTLRLVAAATPPAEWEARYQEDELGDWGDRNPPVGKLLVGLSVAPVLARGEEVRYVWTWPHKYARNAALGNIPPRRILDAARRGIALGSLILLALVYRVGRQLGAPWWAAILGVLVLFTIPNYEFHAIHVGTDLFQLALALGGLTLLVSFPREQRTGSFVAGACLLGASCATKFSSGAFVAGAALAFLFTPEASLKQRWRQAAALGLLAAVTFVALYPHLWANPLSRTRETIDYWTQRKGEQAEDPGLARSAITGIGTKARRTLLSGLVEPQRMRSPSQLFPVFRATWKRSLPLIAALLGLALLRFRPAVTAGRRQLLAIGLAAVLALAVELALTRRIGIFAVPIALGLLAQLQRRREAGGALWPWIWLSTLLLTALWLPFAWDRYFLPLLVVSIPLWSSGLGLLGSTLKLADRWAAAPPSAALRTIWLAAGVLCSCGLAVGILRFLWLG